MKRILLLCATALFVASCDDSSSNGSGSSEQPETGFVGMWAPVINVGMHYFDFRTTSVGVLQIRSSYLVDSIPFTYSAAGGKISIISDGSTNTGTYRFFGSDSVQINVPKIDDALLKKIDSIPAAP